ncbi:MAG: diguanylate cyclase, partial [Polaromonas sp.]|nr:diguanylate cyclase [Polaromonas sp.]
NLSPMRSDLPLLSTLTCCRGFRACLVVWVCALLLVCAATARAQQRAVLDLDTRHQPVLLQDWGDYWIDITGGLTPDEVAQTANIPWRRTATDAIYPLKTGQVMWVRFSVPPAPDTERWYLEVLLPTIDRASLYTLDGLGRWHEQRAGDQIAVADWPVPHRHPLLPIELSAEVPTHYLLRLENNHTISAPLRFISEAKLSTSEQQVSLILGIFFGLTGLAAVVSALGALSLRDAAYGWFSVAVVLLGLTQAALTGIGGVHLWSHSPWWNDASPAVLPVLTISASLMFLSSAVALSERSRRLHWLVVALSGFGLAAAVLLAVVPASSRDGIFVTSMLLLPLCGMGSLFWAWRRGDRFAPWLLLAYLSVLAAAGWTLMRHLGFVPTSLLTQYGMQLGVAIHLPIVMVVLMLRSQHRRENTRRIQGLDRIDPTTGLINGHVFAERLMRMIARSARLRHQSAVLLIDLVNSSQIQRDFGRKAAEDLPLRVAERLLSTAREIDSAARLSELRFGMLVEGPFSAEDAATLGPRIVARCLMPYKGLHVDCVAQVRVAYAVVPHSGDNAHGVLTQLKERLMLEPTNSRRAVFSLHDKIPEGKDSKRAGLRRISTRQEL